MNEVLQQLSETIREAHTAGRPLRIHGGGTKDFYGGPLRGAPLDIRPYCGIIDYEPTELAITVRAGTPLAEVEEVLRRHGQMLAFEPPHFGEQATLGGCIAAGLSGPRRMYAGAVRDLVLGIRLMNGEGAALQFGGRVMKNVAGFDVSRLIAGSLGTLGVILEASLKVLPLPATERTVVVELPERQAIETMNLWAGQPLPVSGTAYFDNRLHVRLSGAAPGVEAAHRKLGGDALDEREAHTLWQALREHTHSFFRSGEPLWRIAVPATAQPLSLPGRTLIEWSGALRWIRGEVPASAVREAAARSGGHATLFRNGDKSVGVFQPLTPALLGLHRRLKHALDPAGIFNRGRLYPDF
ncbi:MAG: glycolate oxidase subunit GlcE [Rhodospirillaceae bacterium]